MNHAHHQLLQHLETHGPRLHALLLKLTLSREAAEELLQDLYLRLCTAPGWQQATNQEAFVVRCAINLAFDWRKQQARDPHVALEEPPVTCPTPLDEALQSERLELVLEAMQKLSSSHREWISMRYIEGLSFAELAQRFHTTPHRARAKCSKALKQLRKFVLPRVTNT